MLRLNKSIVFGLFVLGIVSACAANNSTNSAVQADNCHVIGTIERWRTFDSRHVYVEGADGDSKFLLTTRSMCPAMPYAVLVEIPNPEEPVCNSGSRIAFPDGERRKSCRLSHIDKVANVDEAEALVKSRVNL